jgi:P-type Mg2+ transporter
MISNDEQRLIDLCALPIQEALDRLKTTLKGISSEEAKARLGKYGPNELAHQKRQGFWADIFHRVRSPLIIQLLVIAIVSAVMGQITSTSIVSVMILLSVGLSFVLERKSNNAVESLGRRVQSRALVMREGIESEIGLSEVVPGDIVYLEAGSIVPADLRLITTKALYLNESSLTGESMPIEKSAVSSGLGGESALEIQNSCFFGSSVTSGTATGLVINTGTSTLFGALSERLTQGRTATDFDRGIRSFTLLMIRFMVVMVCLVFFIVGLTKGEWVEALLFGLSVAVGLTPEMLPMMVTVNLAKGALAMSKKKVIIKRLPSIQNFGAMDILCTDKTGTLTLGHVVLERHVDVLGHNSDDVLEYAYLNSFFQTGLRNLIDRTILEYTDISTEECKLVDELPFDFQRRRMSVVVEYEEDHLLICKGAVEEIYTCCSHYQLDDVVYPLLEMIRGDILEEVDRLNRDGFRVLGIAYREFAKSKTEFSIEDEADLVLLGYIVFYDPPKESAREALKLLANVGVNIKVLTGDNGLVTEKICRDVGVAIGQIVTGSDLTRLSSLEFSKTVEEANLFVKLSPADKESIVRELRRRSHVVGFMGDGINDAPALKAADVGISVDAAVDVVKESADIVLLEMSLLVLESGIREGRRVFANIIKYIRMGASSNFGNMFSVLGASYLLPFLPMQPIQILTNNLLYDFSQTGIPLDRVDEEFVSKPLKWNIKNIKRFILFIGPISSIFDYATFALMWFFFHCKDYLSPAVTASEKIGFAALFQTGWFVESLLTQTLIVHIIRTRHIPFFGSRASLQLMATTLIIMAIGAWLPFSPFAAALGMVPLPWSYWPWIVLFLVSYGILTHLVKTWFFNRFGED